LNRVVIVPTGAVGYEITRSGPNSACALSPNSFVVPGIYGPPCCHQQAPPCSMVL
jgi:hypothetical protein